MESPPDRDWLWSWCNGHLNPTERMDQRRGHCPSCKCKDRFQGSQDSFIFLFVSRYPSVFIGCTGTDLAYYSYVVYGQKPKRPENWAWDVIYTCFSFFQFWERERGLRGGESYECCACEKCILCCRNWPPKKSPKKTSRIGMQYHQSPA